MRISCFSFLNNIIESNVQKIKQYYFCISHLLVSQKWMIFRPLGKEDLSKKLSTEHTVSSVSRNAQQKSKNMFFHIRTESLFSFLASDVKAEEMYVNTFAVRCKTFIIRFILQQLFRFKLLLKNSTAVVILLYRQIMNSAKLVTVYTRHIFRMIFLLQAVSVIFSLSRTLNCLFFIFLICLTLDY